MSTFFVQEETGDTCFMRRALEQARIAADNDEVPVGAVVVYEGKMIGRGYNRREELQRPTAHAEMLALEDAAAYLKSWRLDGCSLFVTLEPCIMCVGAMLQARLSRLVYGCSDPKGGAASSLYRLCEDPRLNHRVEVVGGILERECSGILSGFFIGLRDRRKNAVNSEWRTGNGR